MRGIHYESWGKGPPLVLLAGITQDVTHWGPAVQELARHFLVVAHDPRGTGRSTAPLAGLTTGVMAADALEVMDALGIERADVLGFSMGGMVAQVLAARHPERVGRLVLASTAPRLGIVALAALRGALAIFSTAQCAPLANEALAPWLFGEAALEEGSLVRELAARRFKPSLEGFAAQFRALEIHDSTGMLSGIEAPALCLRGSEDALITRGQSLSMAGAMPRARHVDLPGLGHMCLMEDPGAFLKPVLAFLGAGS